MEIGYIYFGLFGLAFWFPLKALSIFRRQKNLIKQQREAINGYRYQLMSSNGKIRDLQSMINKLNQLSDKNLNTIDLLKKEKAWGDKKLKDQGELINDQRLLIQNIISSKQADIKKLTTLYEVLVADGIRFIE